MTRRRSLYCIYIQKATVSIYNAGLAGTDSAAPSRSTVQVFEIGKQSFLTERIRYDHDKLCSLLNYRPDWDRKAMHAAAAQHGTSYIIVPAQHHATASLRHISNTTSNHPSPSPPPPPPPQKKNQKKNRSRCGPNDKTTWPPPGNKKLQLGGDNSEQLGGARAAVWVKGCE